MKQNEFKKCVCCGKGMLHAGGPTFVRLRIEHMVINARNVQQQAGLEMMIGGLASVMGPDRDLAVRVRVTS